MFEEYVYKCNVFYCLDH